MIVTVLSRYTTLCSECGNCSQGGMSVTVLSRYTTLCCECGKCSQGGMSVTVVLSRFTTTGRMDTSTSPSITTRL